MATVTQPRPAVKPATTPASGFCRWQLLPDGGRLGILSIRGVPYRVETLLAHGTVTGYRLTKTDGTVYDVNATAAPWTCDCPDATYHPERPGGCKHVAAIKAALKHVGLLPAATSTGNLARNHPDRFAEMEEDWADYPAPAPMTDDEIDRMAVYFGQS